MEDLAGAETAEPDCIDVSVVIPAYNEGGVIGRVIEGLRTRLDTLGKTHEVIVVDDGSTDSTSQAAADAGAVVVSHAYNMGNGAAVKTGLRRGPGMQKKRTRSRRKRAALSRRAIAPESGVLTIPLGLTLLLCMVGCTGCGGPANSTASTNGAGQIVLSLKNAGFEEWDGNLPLHWKCREGFEGQISRSGDLRYSGQAAAHFAAGYYHNFLQQTIVFSGREFPGRTLVLLARAKSYDAGAVTLSLDVEGLGTFYSQRHPGDGQWQEFRASCRLPTFRLETSATVALGAGSLLKNPVLFDDVQLLVR